MEEGTTLVAVSLLGPTEAVLVSGRASVPGRQSEALLALLALALPHPVSDDRLIDQIWDADQPSNPVNSLQAQVSQLRRMLGRGAVLRATAGYRLALDSDGVDAIRLERLVREGLAAVARSDHRAAVAHFNAAIALLRGPPLVDLLDHAFARDAAVRLDQLVISAYEGMVEGELASGRHAEVIITLHELVAARPLCERFHAQLVLALFRCGRQTEALRACRRARDVLADEVGLDPGPELQALERAVLAHDPTLSAPVLLASIDRQAALPVSLTSFVGRAHEVADVRAMLATSRLVTVVGPPGVGKTRLALAVAADLARRREVRLVELGPIDGPAAVHEALASALGAADRSATSPPASERAARTVGGRSVVVVLDNCEHVAAAAADLIARLLLRCPRLQVLATSRQPLGVDGERQIVVGPMADDDAVALFVERARAVRPAVETDAGDVATLCRRLDGLPLAIELAAAHCKSLPVPEIEMRLEDRFALLVDRPPTGSSPRHGLRNAIDWSYDLLAADEQLAFRRLAVCRGGFGTGAVAALCGTTGLEVVGRLVDRSLVVAEPHGPVARFTMLESLREYALNRLVEAEESAGALSAHARWCIALADDAAEGIRGRDQLKWLDALDAEHDNLVAALTHCATDDPAAGVHLIGALSLPWWFRGRGREARSWIERFASADAPPRDRAAMLTWSGLLADFAGEERGPSDLRAELLLAERRQREAIAIGLAGDDEQTVARARSQCSLTLTRQRFAGVAVDQAAIDGLVDSALATFESCGDDFATGQTCTVRAVGLMASGQVEACMVAVDRGRRAAVRCGDRFVQGRLEWVEGLLAEAAGDVEAAYRHVERGLRFLDELGMHHEVTAQAETLMRLAERRHESGLAEQWRTFVAGRAGGLARHDLLLRASARQGEALQAAAAGQLGRAVDAHREALRAYVEADAVLAVAFTESCLGFLLASMGDPVAARSHHARALRSAAATDDAAALALALEGAASSGPTERPVWAATLLGAAERLRAAGGTAPTHRADLAVVVDRIRRQLDGARFTAAQQRGRTLTTTEVLELVWSTDDPPG